jgi:hypothetical protein
MCRQCARPRATNVRHSGRVRATVRLMSVFLFRIEGRSCPNTRNHERPDYTSRAAQSLVSERFPLQFDEHVLETTNILSNIIIYEMDVSANSMHNRSEMVAVLGPLEALPYYIHTYIHTSANSYFRI